MRISVTVVERKITGVGVGSRTMDLGPVKDCHISRRGPKEEKPIGYPELIAQARFDLRSGYGIKVKVTRSEVSNGPTVEAQEVRSQFKFDV